MFMFPSFYFFTVHGWHGAGGSNGAFGVIFTRFFGYKFGMATLRIVPSHFHKSLSSFLPLLQAFSPSSFVKTVETPLVQNGTRLPLSLLLLLLSFLLSFFFFLFFLFHERRRKKIGGNF